MSLINFRQIGKFILLLSLIFVLGACHVFNAQLCYIQCTVCVIVWFNLYLKLFSDKIQRHAKVNSRERQRTIVFAIIFQTSRLRITFVENYGAIVFFFSQTNDVHFGTKPLTSLSLPASFFLHWFDDFNDYFIQQNKLQPKLFGMCCNIDTSVSSVWTLYQQKPNESKKNRCFFSILFVCFSLTFEFFAVYIKHDTRISFDGAINFSLFSCALCVDMCIC